MEQIELSEECECADCQTRFLWRKHGQGGKVELEEIKEAKCPECGGQYLYFMAKKMQ